MGRNNWTCIWTYINSLSFLIVSPGPAGSGQSPSHRSTKWGSCVASLHYQQCGREDPGRCQVQIKRGPKGHPGRHVRSEILQQRAQGLPPSHPGARGARRGLGPRSVSTHKCVCVHQRHNILKSELSYALLANKCMLYSGGGWGARWWDGQPDDSQERGGVWSVHGKEPAFCLFRYLCPSLNFSSSPSLSVWTWTGGGRRPATRGENLVWWRRTSCPRGSWRMMPKSSGWPARRRRRNCLDEALGCERRWTIATHWPRSSGWRWLAWGWSAELRNKTEYKLNLKSRWKHPRFVY